MTREPITDEMEDPPPRPPRLSVEAARKAADKAQRAYESARRAALACPLVSHPYGRSDCACDVAFRLRREWQAAECAVIALRTRTAQGLEIDGFTVGRLHLRTLNEAADPSHAPDVPPRYGNSWRGITAA